MGSDFEAFADTLFEAFEARLEGDMETYKARIKGAKSQFLYSVQESRRQERIDRSYED